MPAPPCLAHPATSITADVTHIPSTGGDELAHDDRLNALEQALMPGKTDRRPFMKLAAALGLSATG